MDNINDRRREIILAAQMRFVEEEIIEPSERKALTRLTRHPADYTPFCKGETEWQRGGDTPQHFDRLRWGRVGGAVEAKC